MESFNFDLVRVFQLQYEIPFQIPQDSADISS